MEVVLSFYDKNLTFDLEIEMCQPTLQQKINKYLPNNPTHETYETSCNLTSNQQEKAPQAFAASCSSSQCDVVLFPPTGPGISPSLWALENSAEVKPAKLPLKIIRNSKSMTKISRKKTMISNDSNLKWCNRPHFLFGR